MRVEVIMPQMGESIVEGTIVAWHKGVGDSVERDEDICTIQTDKVDAEIPAPQSGIIVEILAADGVTVDVGRPVAILETEADKVSAAPTAAPAPAPVPEPVAAPAPAPAPAALAPPAPAAPAVAPAAPVAADGPRTLTTPLVRRMAEENGITDLSVIPGTGVSGRVTKSDMLRYLAERALAQTAPPPIPVAAAAPAVAAAKPAASTAASAVTSGPLPTPPGMQPMYFKAPRIVIGDKDRVEPLSRMRAAIAENMANARRSTAHCHTVWEADVTHVIQLRKKLKAEYEARGVNLTLTAFFVQALARALSAFPAMNAAFDGENFVYRGNINIGIASALEDGLIVPVLKNADGLNLFGVARGVGDLAARSKSKNLVPADVADGTFTLTNSGVFGSLYGIPILVTPQVGILNLGGINKRVVADEDDNIRIRSIMNICLTFDHRVIDGSTADGFCGAFVKELANFKAS